MRICNQCKELKDIKCFTVINDILNRNAIMQVCRECVNINKLKHLSSKTEEIIVVFESLTHNSIFKNLKFSIFILFVNGLSGKTGLQRAKELIKQPIGSHRQIKDVILSGICRLIRRKCL